MSNLQSIWDEHSCSCEKYIRTKLENTGVIDVYAATNQITGSHLLVIELDKEISGDLLKKAKFRGLAVQILEFDEHKELTILLLDNSLEDTFILFIENILEEIVFCKDHNDALKKISSVILRWKKLFDKSAGGGLTLEQQKGLIGELLLFRRLLSEGYSPEILADAWSGPQHADKDFTFGSCGIEVKLTSSKYPRLSITNERQLETESLDVLYLALFIVEEVKKDGFNLPRIAGEIRTLLSGRVQAESVFEKKLELSGYSDIDEDLYDQQYYLKDNIVYEVNDSFPRLVNADLATGIYNVSYTIELSACESHRIEADTITKLINEH